VQDSEWLDEPKLGEVTEAVDNIVRDYRPLYNADAVAQSEPEKVRSSSIAFPGSSSCAHEARVLTLTVQRLSCFIATGSVPRC
jgi:hypothetical protein